MTDVFNRSEVHMKVKRNAAWVNYISAADDPAFTGRRIKRERDRPLMPGGRARLTLFERIDDGRPNPRLQVTVPPVDDPKPDAAQFTYSGEAPMTIAALDTIIEDILKVHAPDLEGADLDDSVAPKGSEKYWKNNIRAQRVARLFAGLNEAVSGWIAQGLPRAALVILRRAEDVTYARSIHFDDHDTRTYHSFQHDAPFVHYLESILESLPDEHSEGFIALPAEQQASLLRQRTQAQNHLDHLMRHKYAYDGITEVDIEQTLGGLLIDKETRHIASETPESADSLQPEYELLRIDPNTAHTHAGAWIHRDGKGGLRLDDGTTVTVTDEQLRRIPREASALTFKRAPKSQLLRDGVRFDWNGNGYVQRDPIGWVSWAGHCDIKAILEQLGITLSDAPSLKEYRSDTGMTSTYSRDLILEMIASTLELGSLYVAADGSGRISRGVHRFGGFRNDSRPDRIQFTGPRAGRGLRWPLSGRKDTFTVVEMEDAEGAVKLGEAFQRLLPDTEALTLTKNPRYLKTVEGDYNIIDVSSSKLVADVEVQSFDANTGYLTTKRERSVIDLRAEGEGRSFLGTWIRDPAERVIFRVYLDREFGGVIAEAHSYSQIDGKWVAEPSPVQDIRLPLKTPFEATLSREMKRDDPSAYSTLLEQALRHAQNICADTDMTAPVWNGVVTWLRAEMLDHNDDTRVEHWSVTLEARFGNARMDYLIERDEEGNPVRSCPVAIPEYMGTWPDFLWQDFPDVGSKGLEGGRWVINETMLKRGIVSRRHDPGVQGEVYVYDEHIKSLYELMFSALAGYRWSIVHSNKRYGYKTEAAWKADIALVEALRAKITFDDPNRIVESSVNDSLINVNTAARQALIDLPVLGPVLTDRLIAYREANGPFGAIDDLVKVKGIGRRNLEMLRPYVCV